MAPSAAFALVALSAASPAVDPCDASSAPLPEARGVDRSDLEVLEAYRAAWRRACDGSWSPADLADLLGDAEAVTADVSTSAALERLAAALPAGAAWPFPAVRREGDEPLEADWVALGAAARLGTAEDGRFWRGAALAAGRSGRPSWLGEPVPGGERRCLRLGEVSWAEIADAIDDMEGARSKTYVRYARSLRGALVETLGALAKGPQVCGCVRGDAAGGLEPLAASLPERLGTPARRAVAGAAGEALSALRSGRTRVRWLREAPGAAPAGCGPSP